KDDSENDWDAFNRQLQFPLSPSRAKANGSAEFNAEGRVEAGLSPEFVRQLRGFERSKGRTPRVFWFCPDPENAMADPKYQRRAEVHSLARDLDILPAFLAAKEDIVLVRRMPSLEHRERLLEAGFALPEFEELDADENLKAESLTKQRKLGELRPWAWCPQSEELYADLPGERFWNPEVCDLFSKLSDQQLQDETVVVRDAAELPGLASEREVVVKAPFGASGQRNQRWAGDPTVRWAERIIAKQHAVVVEPWFDRVFEFSVQYEMERDGRLRKLGFVRVENNPRGQFVAAEVGPKILNGLSEGLAKFMALHVLKRYDEDIREQLQEHIRPSGYRGPIGVDAFVYRDDVGDLKLRPVVEINPRYTMGRVAWELRKRMASGVAGCWVRFELRQKGETPNGAILLNDPKTAERTQASLCVASSYRELSAT
ncbi:MAG: hypothetical protein AAF585_07155, partial [Verrucomicrobiota bacterium]